MSKWGPRSNEKPSPAKRPKTFWLDQDTFAKLKQTQAAAVDPVVIIEEIREAIIEKIEALYREMLEKSSE